jgi:hypothetical protein
MTNAINEVERSERATAPLKPVAQPNLMHQQILGSLLDIRQTTRSETRHRRDRKTGRWVDQQIDVPQPTIAGNVSDLNCERAAKRWLP